jgi:hypothetical protein
MTQPSFIQTQQDRHHYLWNCQALPQPEPALFAPPQDLLQQNTLGRGTAVMFRFADMELVRRHYQRGGLVRHLSRDTYIGWDIAHTRMWREFHLLRELSDLGLPVPQPVAARCTRVAPLLHRGDLVTRRIPASRTFAEHLRDGPISETQWRQLGKLSPRRGLPRRPQCQQHFAGRAGRVLSDRFRQRRATPAGAGMATSQPPAPTPLSAQTAGAPPGFPFLCR